MENFKLTKLYEFLEKEKDIPWPAPVTRMRFSSKLMFMVVAWLLTRANSCSDMCVDPWHVISDTLILSFVLLLASMCKNGIYQNTNLHVYSVNATPMIKHASANYLFLLHNINLGAVIFHHFFEITFLAVSAELLKDLFLTSKTR